MLPIVELLNQEVPSCLASLDECAVNTVVLFAGPELLVLKFNYRDIQAFKRFAWYAYVLLVTVDDTDTPQLKLATETLFLDWQLGVAGEVVVTDRVVVWTKV
ncbi:hypothetical protein L915_16161 [Phytophthora nicotianae]|uniref:Uncharacterized protein n=1 Tax=Phytophthora nicotianae TaxID=4792 RepID=W2G5Q8_PHYNI|nr:hypothetical protein L915_16161 [Phytophthora nicotianae]